MSFSGSIFLATESSVAVSVSTVASLRFLVLARTTIGSAPKRLATIPAAPFASLSNTLWSRDRPKAAPAILRPWAAVGSAAGKTASNANNPVASDREMHLDIMTFRPVDRNLSTIVRARHSTPIDRGRGADRDGASV